MFDVLRALSKKCILACLVATPFSILNAEEMPALAVLDGVLICDTVEQVVDFMDYSEANPLSSLDQVIWAVEGCGKLVGPAMVMVTNLAPMEREQFVVMIAKIQLIGEFEMMTQYGLSYFRPRGDADSPDMES